MRARRLLFPEINRSAWEEFDDRTQTAILQTHCFKVMESALAAQAAAVRLA